MFDRKVPVAILSLVVVAMIAVSGCGPKPDQTTDGGAGESNLQTPKLLVELPEFCLTPDGMDIDKDGNLIVACPNYGSYAAGATKGEQVGCFIKITKDGKVSKLFDSPILEATGRACPMGIAIGPQGEIYVSDNQNWPDGNGEKGDRNQGRILRLTVQDGKLTETVTVAGGISHPNGVRYRNGKLYVTVSMLPKVKREDGLLTSAVYVFPADGKDITVTNTLEDPQVIASFPTLNKHCQYGADGIVFDSKGNLFIGNFGDGALHKITFDADGKVTGTEIFAKTDHDYTLDPKADGFLAKATKAKMRTTDGICIDKDDNIYVADFSNNAVAKVEPCGTISVIAQNGDNDGKSGLLDQPGEPIIWNGKLVVTCFDKVTGPDKVNKGHDAPHTITTLELK
jgi:sugar lactone lactonase YvrE